ncbi:DUF7002 family protein [Rhizobium rhizogenes]|uniref:DUF7002 family protein n=1 Tax=Rhizobium rhizogenes TaxID=359 RepID=UPI0005A97072|nr:hypothetical protein [Rhizobium rhizogenes]NTG62997.1 hypothetical protein [Rhizobium rhizogenes]NTG69505.1 hypothetical protein [Rhizobium rhizogenes]NTG82458.1 hypothetical protein [Rhizobium rhizogenes]NTH27773.1 hypothetical protein [Rhizobium rhizogenes]NTH98200.1 hypothetical protein [Rhizobium rhizogenes]
MTEEELVANYPRLYHMAHDGAWPAIQQHGLLSASALLDLYKVTGDERFALESRRRPESVPLKSEPLLGAVIRDQKPMRDHLLEKCLQDGLSPKDWYEILNSRSFFWLSASRIWRLLKAKAYRNQPQTVLTIDSAELIAAHRDRIWLSTLNSGSTLFNPQPRGFQTFRRIEDFPYKDRSKQRRKEDNVVELVVDYSVPDVAKYVLAVHRVAGNEILEEIWRSDRSTADDHP